MQRKPLIATVLVSAVVGAVIAGLAPAASASPDTSPASSADVPTNRGWQSGLNRGWDHEETLGDTSTNE